MAEVDLEKAFRQLHGPLVAFFRKRGFSPEEAEELAQDTWVRVYEGRETFRGESTLKTWIYQIARHVLSNEIRRRKAQKRDIGLVGIGRDDVHDDSDGALEGALRAEAIALLESALQDLPKRMRQCVQLRLRELSYRQIAAVMGVSVNTVKRQIHDAKKRLAKKLAAHYPVLLNKL